jgi:pimeloyl-ACP methyl ester carboxylesterase
MSRSVSQNTSRSISRFASPSSKSGGASWLAGLGLGLLASWLVVRAKSGQAERAHPPAGKFITVDGVRLHYLERGTGPALVLLHGNGVDALDWERSSVLGGAAEHYRVIAFDRPGFGHSERPRSTVWTPDAQARLLHRALQELRVESAIVVGHSLGALVALAMGLQVPDFVRGLVLVSGYYYPSARFDAAATAPQALPLVGDLLCHTVAPLAGRLLWSPASKLVFSPLPVSERFERMPPWMALRPAQLRAGAADGVMMAPAAMSLARRYSKLKVPAQILAGTQDRVCDCGHNAERLHGALRHSELALSPGVGHMLHYAEPAKVIAAIDAIAALVGEPQHLPTPQAAALAAASASGV